jgi:hypothetical protein
MGCTCSYNESKEDKDIEIDGSKVKANTEEEINLKTTKQDTHDNETVNRTDSLKKINKYTITVETSEPQTLDPSEVFYIKDTNPQPMKMSLVKLEEKQKILRAPTFDVILTEKIQNGANIDEILNDPRFKNVIQG